MSIKIFGKKKTKAPFSSSLSTSNILKNWNVLDDNITSKHSSHYNEEDKENSKSLINISNETKQSSILEDKITKKRSSNPSNSKVAKIRLSNEFK